MEQNIEDIAILRMPEVKKLTGISRSSIYRMMADGIFPNSVSLGSRAVGWMVGDIRAWLQRKRAIIPCPVVAE